MSDSNTNPNTNSNATDNRGLWDRETGLPTLTAQHAARRPTAPDTHPAEPHTHLQAMRLHRIAAAASLHQDERQEEERRAEDRRAEDGNHDAVQVRIQWAETTRYEADLYVDPLASEDEIFNQLAALPDSARRVLDVVDSNHLLSVVDLDGDGHLDAYELSASMVTDWGDLADSIDERIAESPSWIALNAALVTAAARDGYDVAGNLPQLAAEAPLPHHDPAGELYYRMLNNGAVDVVADSASGPGAQPPPRRNEAPTYRSDAPHISAPAI